MRQLDISNIPPPKIRPVDCVVNTGTAIICPCEMCTKEWDDLFKSLKDSNE
jgi:hypothetical protein